MAETTRIKRNGKLITLSVVKYQGNNVLARGSDGQMYVKIGRGAWSVAELEVR